MNHDKSYTHIVLNGEIEDREELYRLFQQKGKSNKFTKVDIREHLTREFIDACIFNEKNKKRRELFKDSGWNNYEDKSFHGLRTAIFWLGYSHEQIDEIENTAIHMAHKYYPEEPDSLDNLPIDSVWKSELTFIRSDSLEKGMKFRWFKSDSSPIYSFDRIEEFKVYALDNNGNFCSWKHYERTLVYIDKKLKPLVKSTSKIDSKV